MQNHIRLALAAVLISFPLLSLAEGITNSEESFLRGFFDHQWLAVSYDQLALKKGSKEEVRKFAQSELDMYRALGDKASDLNKRYGLIALSTNAPKIGDGTTRGFTALPQGAQWAGVTILGSLAGGGKLDTNTNALVNDSEMLGKLNGEQFDREYAVRIIMLHQRMLRHTLREMQPGTNADVLAFAKEALEKLNQQNEAAENIYNGRPTPSGPPPTP
ncbi:MAG: DUF4142 domain-containing protein [Steroidobacteraceae bacterium]